MGKQKRWQLFVILVVLAWTIYNILPTIIYYSRPLSSPVGASGALNIEQGIDRRIDELVKDDTAWLESFCNLIGVHASSIVCNEADPSMILLTVSSPQEAKLVEKFLPRAGANITQKASQLSLGTIDGNQIQIFRRVGITIPTSEQQKFFSFLEKRDASGLPTKEYYALVKERFLKLGMKTGGLSDASQMVVNALAKNDAKLLEEIASNIDEIGSNLTSEPTIQARLLKNFFQTENPKSQAQSLSQAFANQETALKTELENLAAEQTRLVSIQSIVPTELTEKQNQLKARRTQYQNARSYIEKSLPSLDSPSTPYTIESLTTWLDNLRKASSKSLYVLSLEHKNPILRAAAIDWKEDRLVLLLQKDIENILSKQTPLSETQSCLNDFLKKLVLNEIALISQSTGEAFKGDAWVYSTPLSQSPCNGLITLSLEAISSKNAASLKDQLSLLWHPESPDLSDEAMPRFTLDQYLQAPKDQQKLCIVIASPSASFGGEELKPGSLYVLMRGGLHIISRGTEANQALKSDLDSLISLLQQRGFTAYSGKFFGPSSPYVNDIVFEQEQFAQPFIEATKEAFYTPGSSSFAYLECGTLKDRIAAENRIDDSYQDDLLKWKESYEAASVSLNPADHFLVAKPTKNAVWSNFVGSWRKYWRGDESKVLKWGLDLSGGKSVRVGLVDQASRPVTKENDLKQATSELYQRLNKMGVSERTLRIENDTILIDFPGVAGVSAAELIKASAMYFHIVNEKFGPFDTELAKQSRAFLQDVWNEALVTNNKDSESLNTIAFRKVEAVRSGLAIDPTITTLLEAGLVLEDPSQNPPTVAFNDTVSAIARWQSEDPSEWYGNTNPLMIVFKNYALEGSNLENVHATYDPSKGNILVFNIRSSDSKNQAISPRDVFYTWTSQFSQEGIQGTPKEVISKGRGWRMAVILNGSVINAPALSSALKDSAMISGNFSQREAEKLASNLQAGSLSFTPKILSEQNVSPELGAKERSQGLTAAALAVIVVIGVMVAYYRFSGAVASIAVLFNILIIWAVMQNIEAAITLPALAGIVLTVAMAVDANVLVFERIREEFAITHRIASAISLGYEKAFSAITDSNLTTIIAAFILTQFDCGPVRGFAITLIIGLVSSMFTSLFVTKYYFTHWAERPQNTLLHMANWIKATNFDFLAWKKIAIFSSLALFLVGALVTATTWKSMFGMDFTGGYALSVEVSTSQGLSPKEAAEKALLNNGVTTSEIQIRELGRPTFLRIQLSSSLEEKGKPFHALPQALSQSTSYEYQNIPRLSWVVTTLEKGGLTIRPSDKNTLPQHWTAISGQFSDAMRNSAAIALSLSIVAILIYIAVRFEWVYAVSAVLALLHDVLLTLALLAILRLFGLPVQINLEVIGALMTIIGYSLNDTIIIFDRIREDITLYKKKNFSQIVNMALNSTLSRTIMTSGITLLVLLCLVCFGGASIFGFSFVMFLGIFLGTLSSLFIAGPLLIFFHTREEREHH